MMMAVIERNLQKPRAVGLAFHGIGVGIPVIEIADERHDVGFRGVANEVDRLGHFLGGVAVEWLVGCT